MGFKFEDEVLETTVEVLIKGEDYRTAVVQAINTEFLNFTIEFLQKVLDAKRNNEDINEDWYKKKFITDSGLDKNDVAWFSGSNLKTISNIEGGTSKNIVIDYSKRSYDYLKQVIEEIEEENKDKEIVRITLGNHFDFNGFPPVSLNFVESLIVMNTLATKRSAIRGGAWSSIGKKVEKPFLDRLCELAEVPEENIDNSTFQKDKSKDVDREVDYKLKSNNGYWNRIEVKLMGKGNPESADVFFARDSNVIIADTLSEQNKNQLRKNNIQFIMTKNNSNVLKDFKKILDNLNVPYNK